ncbi:glycerophosphodiester phosphodiesterase [Daejeonia sp. YH14]|uniref:glycerophosphodiester phosphodiesterase n=1 Tax=Daejeonia sp. YH14 TaxID=3439042 RepID=UPI003F493ED2
MKKLIITFVAISSVLSAQTQIIAHRGFWKTDPPTTENSLRSLENAQKLGIYGSEFDIRMTKDGVLVINHDEHHGDMEISNFTYRELNKVKLSNGENFPKLENYLKQGKKYPGTKLIVEIKPAKTEAQEDEIVQKVIKEIERQKLEAQVEYISFSLNICKEIKKLRPGATVQYLNGERSPDELKALNIDGFDYHWKILTEKHPDWIARGRELGLITNSWTVNDPEVFRKLNDMGIGFVTTNTPDVFKKLLNDEK